MCLSLCVYVYLCVSDHLPLTFLHFCNCKDVNIPFFFSPARQFYLTTFGTPTPVVAEVFL